MLKDVVARLLEAYGIDNKARYFGYDGYAFVMCFINETRPDNLNNRKLHAVKKFAQYMNVPTAFIIRILELERVDDIWI